MTRQATLLAPLATEADFHDRCAEFADELAGSSAIRDDRGGYPWQEAAQLVRTGLLAASVPASHGGLGLSRRAIALGVRTLARADPSLATVAGGHFRGSEVLRPDGLSRSAQRFVGQLAGSVAGGAQLGSASVRDGSRGPGLTLVPDDAGFRLSGRADHVVGVQSADWIVVATALDGRDVSALVPPAAVGVHLDEGEELFGLRALGNSALNFAEVVVPAEHVLVRDAVGYGQTGEAFGDLLDLAVDVGIASAALHDGREQARPRVAPLATAAEDPRTAERFAQLSSSLHTLEQLLGRGGTELDEGAGDPVKLRHGIATLGEARAFAQESVSALTGGGFEPAGVRSTRALDRHWRNFRAHGLSNPPRRRSGAPGVAVLDGAPVRGG